jgi:pimeloyl-ACP methyl ester carboxylesterase
VFVIIEKALVRHTTAFISVLFFLATAYGAGITRAQSASPVAADKGSPADRSARSTPAGAPSTPVAARAIVIGFLGGYVGRDNVAHSEVQLAAKLRAAYPTGVDIETFENHHGKAAQKDVLRLLDTDGDGSLTIQEKDAARIILYGHSWGASETVALARRLQKQGVPVLLTIQIDSVRKRHEDDRVIPPNVAEAVNFYQTHGFIHGHPIAAADPARTKIVGNFLLDYTHKRVSCVGYPWWDRLTKAHTQIECDSDVWDQVEKLIREKLDARNKPSERAAVARAAAPVN